MVSVNCGLGHPSLGFAKVMKKAMYSHANALVYYKEYLNSSDQNLSII